MIEGEADITVDKLQRDLVARLAPRYGEGEAKAMVRLMFHHFKGWNVTDIVINSDVPVSDWLLQSMTRASERVESGEPLQYVLGEARFYGLDLKVSPSVLIPRPETEELVEIIIKENTSPDLRVLDVGTGSGAIAVALARNLKFPVITAIDLSPDALKVARENARNLRVKVDFIEADIFTFDPRVDSFDIIVSNPPYIAESEKKDMEANVLMHEPHSALFVPDSDPLVFYRRIALLGLTALAGGGRLYFEINPLFATQLKSELVQMDYSEVEILEDISRKARFIQAVKGSR